ncbi:hypothetical protein PRO82_000846 [Candidatus Protochlamydia amoebophila]|nr:hypothetical protein [Candidatus Protochlamydia amoebophila]
MSLLSKACQKVFLGNYLVTRGISKELSKWLLKQGLNY